jgi:hypothetical protein
MTLVAKPRQIANRIRESFRSALTDKPHSLQSDLGFQAPVRLGTLLRHQCCTKIANTAP